MTESRSRVFTRGDPYATHESHLELTVRQNEIEGLADLLQTPAMLVREMANSEGVLINGELERYLSSGVSGAGPAGPH